MLVKRLLGGPRLRHWCQGRVCIPKLSTKILGKLCMKHLNCGLQYESQPGG